MDRVHDLIEYVTMTSDYISLSATSAVATATVTAFIVLRLLNVVFLCVIVFPKQHPIITSAKQVTFLRGFVCLCVNWFVCQQNSLKSDE